MRTCRSVAHGLLGPTVNFERSLIVKKQLCRQLVIGLGIASLGLVTNACQRDKGATQDQQAGEQAQDETATGEQQAPGEDRMGAADQPEGAQQQPGQAGTQPQAGEQPPGGEQAQLDQQTVQGLQELHAINRAQIQLGEMAQDKELSDRAKELASMIVEDHKNADEQLMTMTQELGIQLQEEPQLPAGMQSRMQNLQQAEGQQFEQQFVRQESEMIQQNLDKVRQLRQQATNERVTSYLDQVMQAMQKQQEQAKALQGQAS